MELKAVLQDFERTRQIARFAIGIRQRCERSAFGILPVTPFELVDLAGVGHPGVPLAKLLSELTKRKGRGRYCQQACNRRRTLGNLLTMPPIASKSLEIRGHDP